MFRLCCTESVCWYRRLVRTEKMNLIVQKIKNLHDIALFCSLIIHYIVADDVSPSGKAVFQYSLQGYKQLGQVIQTGCRILPTLDHYV